MWYKDEYFCGGGTKIYITICISSFATPWDFNIKKESLVMMTTMKM